MLVYWNQNINWLKAQVVIPEGVTGRKVDVSWCFFVVPGAITKSVHHNGGVEMAAMGAFFYGGFGVSSVWF